MRSGKTYILGISAFYHDSAAALLCDGKIVAAAQEERFTRKKHDDSFPENAVRFCLEEAGIQTKDLDVIAFYDKPFLKFERLLETYYGFAPKGIRSFLMSIPVWIKEKLFLRKLLVDEFKKIGTWDRKKTRFLFPEHHLSHGASAFFASPFAEAAILTIDGVGEWATASIGRARGNQVEVLQELRFPHSLGLLYSAFTYFLGFRVNSGEYKLMGLAPYGNPTAEQTAKFRDLIKTELIDLKTDGSVHLDQTYFKYAFGLRMVQDRKWEKLFGFPRREAESELTQAHCDLALAIQQVTEEAVLNMAQHARKITSMSDLVLAGGVALNCVANGKLLEAKIFDQIFIQPAAGDAGGALGAAWAAHYIDGGHAYMPGKGRDGMSGAYLGPEFSDKEILQMARSHDAAFTHFPEFDDLAKATAKIISEGNVVGWFQGRMEWGPRSLGNRSILGDPRNPEMQKKLNLKIKYRESFRPFAPSVLAGDVDKYFDLEVDSPYMLLVAQVKNERRKKLPEGFQDLPLLEKLYFERSDLPAITHLDFSARVQTVHHDTNPRFWELISAFRSLTGESLLVNTSFNVRGEPIVCTPGDAYRCFMRTEMDYLVVGNYLFAKNDQPEWPEKETWKEDYPLD
ncbi:MAG: carbamoyltransferase [Bacteroidia bacterium]|nr:carbamoyltransferase [Bacteroidia bacterium]